MHTQVHTEHTGTQWSVSPLVVDGSRAASSVERVVVLGGRSGAEVDVPEDAITVQHALGHFGLRGRPRLQLFGELVMPERTVRTGLQR